MEDEQLLERPADVRSVPFRQRWAVATAGLGPRPLGPLVRRRHPPCQGEVATTFGGRRDPRGQCTFCPPLPADFGLPHPGLLIMFDPVAAVVPDVISKPSSVSALV